MSNLRDMDGCPVRLITGHLGGDPDILPVLRFACGDAEPERETLTMAEWDALPAWEGPFPWEATAEV